MNKEIPDIANKKAIDKVQASAEYVLVRGNYVGEDRCLTGIEIKTEAEEIFGPAVQEIPKNTYLQYLSVLASSGESLISRPVGKKGYFSQYDGDEEVVEELVEPFAPESLISENDVAVTRVQREASLYPLVQGWLKLKNYQAKDISSKTSNKKWGNPDVLGLRIEQAFDSYAIEIISVEVKTSDHNWRQLIFEAVSHRRFANRSYFCFAEKRSRQLKISEEMRYYSDLFSVGVLIIYLPDAEFDKLHNTTDLDEVDLSDFDIVEQLSASGHYVSPTHQFTFLKNLGLDTVPRVQTH